MGGNRSLLGEWGGYKKAVERLMLLRHLPDGTPTRTTARGAIDRFQLWSTSRLTGPEVASDGHCQVNESGPYEGRLIRDQAAVTAVHTVNARARNIR